MNANTDFDTFFHLATGHTPFPYQRRLATAPRLAELVSIPTGLGKTAAVVLAWLWRRRHLPEDGTPRRLVYCLPTRVLVEQVRAEMVTWLHHLGILGGDARFDPRGHLQHYDPWGEPDAPSSVRVHLIMGGDADRDWDTFPEREAVLVGTQDMLLSRALNRGYAMPRHRWPMPFGLLHNDALWVFDEVQLMGSGLATTAQLHALRQRLGVTASCRSVWMSATMEPSWLETVDNAPNVPHLNKETLTADDRTWPEVSRRFEAHKPLRRLDLRLCADTKKSYPAQLARAVMDRHRPGAITLVMLNTVDRAVAVHQAICKGLGEANVQLLHSRFRAAEREAQRARLGQPTPQEGRVIVSTQVVEAGVNLDARVLVTELAPWASLVQRFGRCNRFGTSHDAELWWIDLDQEKLAAPYEPADLDRARDLLEQHQEVGPAHLRRVTFPLAITHVVRAGDLLDLFDITPDLAGADVDVARFIRERDDHHIRVFWRDLQGNTPPEKAPRPVHAELCPAPIGDLRAWLKKKRPAYRWDRLDKQWSRVQADDLYPGLTLMLDTKDGGYDPRLGWSPRSRRTVLALEPETHETDPYRHAWVTLAEHTDQVVNALVQILSALPLPARHRDALLRAARHHDWGKAHGVFQRSMLGDPPQASAATLWGKSGREERVRHGRVGFRHELASGLAMLQTHLDDLAAYLAAAHHGRVRLSIRSLPNEPPPADHPSWRFARGVYSHDTLPEADLGGGEVKPPVTLDLSYMELGDGPEGPSWAARMLALRDAPDLGPFRLAYLEALLRAADQRASAKLPEEG